MIGQLNIYYVKIILSAKMTNQTNYVLQPKAELKQNYDQMIN